MTKTIKVTCWRYVSLGTLLQTGLGMVYCSHLTPIAE